MTRIKGFNLPGEDVSELPRSAGPSAEDLQAMKTYVETGGIPQSYLKKVAGSTHEGVAIFPRPEKQTEPSDK